MSGDKLKGLAAGLLAAFIVFMSANFGALEERSSIIQFGGFTDWGVKYKCERTDQK